MDERLNFLEKLKGAGALNIYNPMDTAKNISYLNRMKAGTESLEAGTKSAEMDNELKLMTLGREYTSQANTLEEFNQVQDHMVKLGWDPSRRKNFSSTEEFLAAKPGLIMNATEALNAKQGKPSNWYDAETGTTYTGKTEDEMREYVKRGFVDGKNIRLGKPGKTEETPEQKLKTKIAAEKRALEDKKALAQATADIEASKPPAPTELKKLLDERAELPEGSPDIEAYNDRIENLRSQQSGGYTKAQQIDDTRGYYNLKMKTLLDEDGWIKEGMEGQYKELTNQLDKDMIKINKGEKPSWLTGPQEVSEPEMITIDGKEYEVVGRNPDGSIRIKDPDTGKTGKYTK